MNIEEYKNKGKLIRSSNVYDVFDMPMKNLNLSLTELHMSQHTSGHSHEAEEVYVFISGKGRIQLDQEFFDCQGGDVFTIPSGVFHRVWNDAYSDDLKFWSIFQKYGDRI